MKITHDVELIKKCRKKNHTEHTRWYNSREPNGNRIHFIFTINPCSLVKNVLPYIMYT